MQSHRAAVIAALCGHSVFPLCLFILQRCQRQSFPEAFALVQVAHERSSAELRAVAAQVAGKCLPNVLVSLQTCDQDKLAAVCVLNTMHSALHATHQHWAANALLLHSPPSQDAVCNRTERNSTFLRQDSQRQPELLKLSSASGSRGIHLGFHIST